MNQETRTMYPKMKADTEPCNNKQMSSCVNSNYLQTCVSENNQEDDQKIYVAKVPKIYIPRVTISKTESTKLNKHIKEPDIEVKPKPKASPIFRPRAVVSSPCNDVMIGNINKIEERKAKKGLKSDDHIKSKAFQRNNVGTNVKGLKSDDHTKSRASQHYNVKISHRIVAKISES